MARMTDFEKKLARLEAMGEELRKDYLQRVREKKFQCVKCGRQTHIHKWAFIQNYHYVPPFSCNGGAYWNASKTEVCHMTCPKCQHLNYIYNHPQKDKLLAITKKFSTNELFRSVKDEHDPQTF